MLEFFTIYLETKWLTFVVSFSQGSYQLIPEVSTVSQLQASGTGGANIISVFSPI